MINQINHNKNFLEELSERCKYFYFLQEYNSQIDELIRQCQQPFTVAVVGRMKTGKSTIINALAGSPIAITDVEEATATINFLCYGDCEQSKSFIVHYKNGFSETLPLDKLAQWTGKDHAVINRAKETAYLDFFAPIDSLKNMQIVDTPGTGSIKEEHETAASTFLNPSAIDESTAGGRKADAIIYVMLPVARASDEDSLGDFDKTRLSGSDPYNSVCVLHKWDGITDNSKTDALSKASKLKKDMGRLVADIIPISAPVALMAKTVSNDYFELLIEVINDLRQLSEQERKMLYLSAELWDEDNRRKMLRQAHPLPWSSLRWIVQECLASQEIKKDEVRDYFLSLSGITALETILHRRFFCRSYIIKQRKFLSDTQRLLDQVIQKLESEKSDLEKTSYYGSRIFNSIKSEDVNESAWLRRLIERSQSSHTYCENLLVELQKRWESLKGEINSLEMDSVALDHIEHNQEYFESGECSFLKMLLNHNTSYHMENNIERLDSFFFNIRKKISIAEQSSLLKKERSIYSHITRRMDALYSEFGLDI
mgnify:CR=1 FL=1